MNVWGLLLLFLLIMGEGNRNVHELHQEQNSKSFMMMRKKFLICATALNHVR